MATKKITLNELKTLVKKIIKEEKSKSTINEGKLFFDYILQGEDATEENAYNAARGLDWQEVETKEANYPNLDYIDTVNGVGIYYNYGHDGYYFTDETMNESSKPKKINEGIKISMVDHAISNEKDPKKKNKLVTIRGKVLHKQQLNKSETEFAKSYDIINESPKKTNIKENLTVKGKKVIDYKQNGDKSYSIKYDDNTTDKIHVSHDDWDNINKQDSSIKEEKNTKKIKISELRTLVKNIIKEEVEKK